MKQVKFDTRIEIAHAPYPTEQVIISDLLPNLRAPLRTGRQIEKWGLLPRELLGLIVTSSFLGALEKVPYSIAVCKPQYFDGVIFKNVSTVKNKAPRTGLIFEQVYVPPPVKGDERSIGVRLMGAMKKKLAYGAQYAKNINLIILARERADNEFTRMCEQLPYEMIVFINALRVPLLFDVSLLKNEGEYVGGPSRVAVDGVTGLRQVVYDDKQYVILDDMIALADFPVPLRWTMNRPRRQD